MSDVQKLIAEARVKHCKDCDHFIAAMADALEATEKAHTPTDDEREALIHVIYESQFMGSHRLVIRDDQRTADAVLAAGFRRSEVPEPSADWYDTHCPTCDAPEPWHTATCAVVHVKVPEPQGEPSEASVEAALVAYWGSKRAAQKYGSRIDMAAALRAALRAAL